MKSKSNETAVTVVQTKKTVAISRPTAAVEITPEKGEVEHQSRRNQKNLDFVGSSQAFKNLFTVPYATDRDLSVAVHNLGDDSLLIEADSDHHSLPNHNIPRKRGRPHHFDNRERVQPPSLTLDHAAEEKISLSLESAGDDAVAVVSRMLDSTALRDQSKLEQDKTTRPRTSHFIPSSDEPKEYLSWRFEGMDMMVGSSAMVYRSTPDKDNNIPGNAVAVRVAEVDEMRELSRKHQEMVNRGDFETDEEQMARTQASRPSYAQAVKQEQRDTPKQLMSHGSFSAPDLEQVQVQTCVVPSSNTPLGAFLSNESAKAVPTSSSTSAPVCTVLDAYLDNIMANVPQLALCLQEKGLIQSVKLMDTKDIPSRLLAPSTLDTTQMLSKVESSSSDIDRIFSPQIMEMNAATLLRFLKSNCTREGSTYLLRREAGQTNIQLYDVSSISAQRQRKWKWWLAMMSYRFAKRLQQLSLHTSDPARLRTFRARRRNLLENARQLLEDFSDMDGGKHETLRATVSEDLADTFLFEEEFIVDGIVVWDVQSPPYATLSIDQLTKAEDHLTSGVLELWPLLEKTIARQKDQRTRLSKKKAQIFHVDGGSSSDSEDDSEDEIHDEIIKEEICAIRVQLSQLHEKLINVSLRLAEHYMHNYWSSSAMQALRMSARRTVDSISLILALQKDGRSASQPNYDGMKQRVQHQFTWLWEHCGHFARSFAADDLWRERGHASGDDIVSILRDVQNAFSSLTNETVEWLTFTVKQSPLTTKTSGEVSLESNSGVVNSKYGDLDKAKAVLMEQKLIQREKREALVAACVCYSRSIAALEQQLEEIPMNEPGEDMPAKPGEPISIVEHSTPQVLLLLRQRLGDACNEIGKNILCELRPLIGSVEKRATAEALLDSASFWFRDALAAFKRSKDVQNEALVRCNLCQCSKLQANSNFAGDSSPHHVENCLSTAADHLQMAHEVLGERDVDPTTWDMVSQELASTFLVLGVRRRQTLLGGGSVPLLTAALRLPPGKERSIVEPMEKSLKIYEEMGNLHQAAAANYQLAQFYSKVWTCQRDEAKTREKLASAFQHYGAAHDYFCRAPVNELPTFVILSLDLSNLCSAVGGEDCLTRALDRCLDATMAFSQDNAYDALALGPSDWFEKMLALAPTVEDRILKLLCSLVKLEKESESRPAHWKALYREALTEKMKLRCTNGSQDPILLLASYHNLFEAVRLKRVLEK